MSLSERQNQILNWVQQVDNLSIEVLVDKFDVSAQGGLGHACGLGLRWLLSIF